MAKKAEEQIYTGRRLTPAIEKEISKARGLDEPYATPDTIGQLKKTGKAPRSKISDTDRERLRDRIAKTARGGQRWPEGFFDWDYRAQLMCRAAREAFEIARALHERPPLLRIESENGWMLVDEQWWPAEHPNHAMVSILLGKIPEGFARSTVFEWIEEDGACGDNDQQARRCILDGLSSPISLQVVARCSRERLCAYELMMVNCGSETIDTADFLAGIKHHTLEFEAGVSLALDESSFLCGQPSIEAGDCCKLAVCYDEKISYRLDANVRARLFLTRPAPPRYHVYLHPMDGFKLSER